MDDLRWVLLLIGAVVVAAIYVSGRFGREKISRDVERAHRSREDVETSTESFSAADDEPSFSDWAASPTEQPAHDPDAVGVDWAAAVDETTMEPAAGDMAEIVEPAETKPATHAPETTPASRKDASPVLPPVDIKPLVLVLTVMAPDTKPLQGEPLQAALEAEGLRHGDMNIFHFRQHEQDDAVFSVANAVEPGVFDLAAMAHLETPGIMLFCQLPGPLAGDAAFELMLDKARSLAERLDGHLCDDRRNALTVQALTHYHDRIENFTRELVLARKKAADI